MYTEKQITGGCYVYRRNDKTVTAFKETDSGGACVSARDHVEGRFSMGVRQDLSRHFADTRFMQFLSDIGRRTAQYRSAEIQRRKTKIHYLRQL